jgi:diguanylate cyclase (GGDEF)-like protein/putative nucleotidyltransferase with HDIG domain
VSTPPLSQPAALGHLRLVPDETPVFETPDELIAAGDAAERQGQRGEARKCYERALYSLGRDGDPSRAAAVLRWIARTYMVDADPDAALDCLEAALAVAQACGDDAGAGHAINVKAGVYWQRGNLDSAEELFLQAREFAHSAGDIKLGAMTSQNLGVIANIRGDLTDALQHYHTSLWHYRTLGMARDVCVALNNLGKLHTGLQQWADAESAYGEAIQVTEAIGDTSASILLHVNVAEMWITRREFESAQKSVETAVRLSSETGDSASLAEIAKLLGIIARESGNYPEAETQFIRGQQLAEARQELLLLADISRERADLHRRQGRNRDALQSLNRAHRLFTQLRAKLDLANIDHSIGSLEDDFLQVVRRWGESIEAKDRYTQGHCVRVADIACAIAAKSGLDQKALFWFRIGALLHDVGKLVVPPEVLNKPGKLTDEEWALMRRHPSAGVEMLAEIDFPWDVRPIIESHHERWDGKGYPHGLTGEEIPLTARILCVADVYDALTSERSYRRALPHDEAMAIMRADVEKAFDPQVFALFEAAVVEYHEQPEGGVPVSGVPTQSDLVLAEVAAYAQSVAAAAETLDDLTGVFNRGTFNTIAKQALDTRRITGRAASLVVIDVDDLKVLNEAHGHLQGDDALRMVARTIRDLSRSSDVVARSGGDEFVVLLPDTPLVHARAVAERMQLAVAEARCVSRTANGEWVPVSVSIGVSTAPIQGETVSQLIAAAKSELAADARRRRAEEAKRSA